MTEPSSARAKRPRDEEHRAVPQPQRKRPGQSARMGEEARKAIWARQREREANAAILATRTHGVNETVREHYNAVPQRGREWRKTESRIKGLRSFNNWVKSTMIHKFSPDESGKADSLNILDIGCGKGGDLGKWEKAPHPVGYYVGIDSAEISIAQANDRYAEARRRNRRIFDAKFLAEDAFTYSLGDLGAVRSIGFENEHMPGSGGGFDVVSMMFCLHYAFESEGKAKGMLRNVARSLKKGGRFIGVIPSSDVIRDNIVAWHRQENEKSESQAASKNGDSNHVIEVGKSDDQLVKQNNLDSPHDATNHSNSGSSQVQDKQESPKEDSATNIQNTLPAPAEDTSSSARAQSSNNVPDQIPGIPGWGNSLYSVRFPLTPVPPADGIFRPPYGWKYSYFLHEAVEEVPEYVVPWGAFRAMAEDFNLELQYHKGFREIWDEEGSSPIFGPLSERMGVRGRDGGDLLMTPEEMDAVGFYVAFCFYKV